MMWDDSVESVAQKELPNCATETLSDSKENDFKQDSEFKP